MSEDIKYMTTAIGNEEPVVWAFSDIGVLEKDLDNYYYSSELPNVRRNPVSREIAEKTQYWNAPFFKAWMETNSGVDEVYNLGHILEE
jgi:hypothetical protein